MTASSILGLLLIAFAAVAFVSAMLLDRRKPNETEAPQPSETNTPKAMKPRAERFVQHTNPPKET